MGGGLGWRTGGRGPRRPSRHWTHFSRDWDEDEKRRKITPFYRSGSTLRTVSWLTPNSAARSRRLRQPALARIATSCSGESLHRRGAWYGARLDRPLTRRGEGLATQIGSVPSCP